MIPCEPKPVATLALERVDERLWDVVVVGAGPAGAMAARETVQAGLSVLLVDKARFPRTKVCGCCLNGSALATLESNGLAGLPKRLGARPLGEFRLGANRRFVSLPLPAGVALSRERLDAALVQSAVDAGAHFLPDVQAALGKVDTDHRQVRLRRNGLRASAGARVILAADGLGGGLLGGPHNGNIRVASNARMGAATILEHPPPEYCDGTIHMACGKHGYVGLVRLEDGRLDVAAAFDLGFIKEARGPGAAAAHVLREAGFPPIAGIERQPWRGTPALTRHRVPPAAERVFALGDAAGYVEPFTGEGIAWALASATAVLPLVSDAVRGWNTSYITSWEQRLAELIGDRRRKCRALTLLLRRPLLVAVGVAVLRRSPVLARRFLRRLNRPIDKSVSDAGASV